MAVLPQGHVVALNSEERLVSSCRVVKYAAHCHIKCARIDCVHAFLHIYTSGVIPFAGCESGRPVGWGAARSDIALPLYISVGVSYWLRSCNVIRHLGLS